MLVFLLANRRGVRTFGILGFYWFFGTYVYEHRRAISVGVDENQNR